VNKDHPQVIEIWNLVFIQFNRLASGKLENLPDKHVDTGMGFERLCMAIQWKSSNYDTDVFTPLRDFIAKEANVAYGSDSKKDIAIRVMADHVRAVAFAITDGQLPSNTGAGYVVRRILRRAVRYGFSYLDFKEPFLYQLVALLAEQMKDAFPELKQQEEYVTRVIREEERNFLKTLESGILAFRSEMIEIALQTLGSYFKANGLSAVWLNSPDLGANLYIAERSLVIELSFNVETYIIEPARRFEIAIGPETHMTPLVRRVEVNPYFLNDDSFWQLGDLQFDVKRSFSLKDAQISGSTAFILYDTHGFPIDLTQLLAKELGMTVDMVVFNKLLDEQKSRSKADATKETGDWVSVSGGDKPEFIGYEHLSSEASLLKYRKIKQKNKELYQLVFDKTPFYAESGGQVGDTGTIESGSDKIKVIDTKKENELIVHLVEEMPSELETQFLLRVDAHKRKLTMDNHSATHLLHAALRAVLGKHVEQRGSLVNDKILRFDFSHFSAMTGEEIGKVERMVNEKIRENIELSEQRNVPIEKAKEMGAMALFGEKYGDFVRVITFDPKYSVELCGGTHVPSTGRIGLFKILSESSVAAGVRRIEAVTAEGAEEYINNELKLLGTVKSMLKNPKDLATATKNLLEEKHQLEKKLEEVHQQQTNQLKDRLATMGSNVNGHYFIAEKVSLPNSDALKNIAYALRNQFNDLFLVLAAEIDGKPQVAVMIGEKVVKSKKLHAGEIVKELSKEIDGGGGGQPFFATAGGKNINGLDAVIEKAREISNR
jgi:alanyl-tRNA synthetase